MNTSAARYEQFSPVGTMRVLAAAIGLLVLLGLVLANSVEQLLAYLVVLSAAVLWRRTIITSTLASIGTLY